MTSGRVFHYYDDPFAERREGGCQLFGFGVRVGIEHPPDDRLPDAQPASQFAVVDSLGSHRLIPGQFACDPEWDGDQALVAFGAGRGWDRQLLGDVPAGIRTSASELQANMEYPSGDFIRKYADEVFGEPLRSDQWMTTPVSALALAARGKTCPGSR